MAAAVAVAANRPLALAVVAVIVDFPSLSAPSQGLLSMPCSRCGAIGGEWCRRRPADVNRQHQERYAAWRKAGLPLGPTPATLAASDRTVPVLHTLAEHLRDGTVDAHLIDGPRLRVQPIEPAGGTWVDVELSTQHGRFFSMNVTPLRIFGSVLDIEATASRIRYELLRHSDSA